MLYRCCFTDAIVMTDLIINSLIMNLMFSLLQCILIAKIKKLIIELPEPFRGRQGLEYLRPYLIIEILVKVNPSSRWLGFRQGAQVNK